MAHAGAHFRGSGTATPVDDRLISRLRAVGFSLYEARVYVALLRHGSQNGNEVATRAAVPSSKVYAALEKLASAGCVQSSRRGSSTRWAALPADELVGLLRKQYNDPLDFLAKELPKVQTWEPTEPFLTVSGLSAIHEAATALIRAANQEIHISCWEPDMEALREALTAAHDRGVRVFGMLYGEADPPPGSWLRHHYESIVAQRIAGRLVAVAVDDTEALVGQVPDEGDPSAVRSRNAVMTLVVKEYLHHDRVLQRAQGRIGFQEWDTWWQSDPDARAEILGRSLLGAGTQLTHEAN